MMVSLLGGICIGLSAALLLVMNNKILGVSGILQNAVFVKSENKSWQLSFIGGVVLGGLLLQTFMPQVFSQIENKNILITILAGFLVGFGTSLGSGCTSGHGICGVSRLSLRSIVATIIFMITAMITVYGVRHL
jgi:uncharacterized membrane protein YedE/YeeE